MQMIGQILGFLGAMAQNDPVAAAILLIGLLIVPSLVALDAFWGLYWLGWWSTAVALVVATHQRQPLRLGGALSRSAAALLTTPRPSEEVHVTTFAAAGDGHADVAPASTPAPGTPASDAPRGPSAVDVFRDKVNAVAAAFKDDGNGASAPAGGASVAWTGARITGADRQREELRRLEHLEHALNTRVQGQEHVARAVSQAFVRAAAGVRDAKAARRPVLSVLLAGPTGTGKTEFTKAVAENLKRPLVRYDMAEYATEHTVASLVGAPAGYVGSDRAGKMLRDLNAHPNAVLLLDEIEKAHPRLYDPFLPLLDEGRWVDLSTGEVASGSDVILMMTTNMLAQEARQAWTDDPARVRAMLLDARFGAPGASAAPQAGGGLRPELINRIDLVVLFKPLSRDTLEGIARGYVASFVDQVAQQQGLSLSVDLDHAVLEAVLLRCEMKFGARDLHRAVADLLGNALVDGYLPCLEAGTKPTRLRIAVEGGKVTAAYSAETGVTP